ncbi:hypothetical protein Ae331Ps2_5943c [Pseudonocardia sp. Ae331_Ps2]|nr:hypothetical protein Ae331Ps2_5936c [Pseudonocardia sp. Ae331_Ps2]OLL89604.1 hypothetical protein Ae331Ps2_5938c [Pseudonocardia sp. Ae331_Ps2]OLL89609.1 hypothetical protein Ae331Ps2_5943c [Pseudonocardia sp. Ae331_Ps2]
MIYMNPNKSGAINKPIRDTSSPISPTPRRLTVTAETRAPDSRHRHRKSPSMTP